MKTYRKEKVFGLHQALFHNGDKRHPTDGRPTAVKIMATGKHHIRI
jgi:hypothetical protein